jgi:hypothetical protein
VVRIVVGRRAGEADNLLATTKLGVGRLPIEEVEHPGFYRSGCQAVEGMVQRRDGCLRLLGSGESNECGDDLWCLDQELERRMCGEMV